MRKAAFRRNYCSAPQRWINALKPAELLRTMTENYADILRQIEHSPDLTKAAILAKLRSRLSLEEFGDLMFQMPMRDFPKISALLPSMASQETQILWTGNHGKALLDVSLTFVRSVAWQYKYLTGRPLDGVSMLDFGCGYGRLARLMYYYTDSKNLFGVDPWINSVQLCRESGLGENFRQSEYLPAALPLPATKFQFIYAFSVFTHLSRAAAAAAMNVCRRYIADDGVFLITVRPAAYWDVESVKQDIGDTAGLLASHRQEGFAFRPHDQFDKDGNVVPGDENSTYGDTSMTLDWIRDNFPDWRIRSVECPLADPFQDYVYLQPK